MLFLILVSGLLLKEIILDGSVISYTAILLLVGGCSLAQNTESSTEIYIGDQIWMSRNLNTSKFRNGDLILEVKTKEEWQEAGRTGQPAWCYYENNPSRGKKYGKLYNWYAINDPRGLAPTNWHIPTNEEWIELIEYLGGKEMAANKMISTKGLNNVNYNKDKIAFNALPSGARWYDHRFYFDGSSSWWWSSSEYEHDSAWYLCLGFLQGAYVERSIMSRAAGFSVRCIRD